MLQAGRSFAYTVAKNLDLLAKQNNGEHVRQVRKDCASVILDKTFVQQIRQSERP